MITLEKFRQAFPRNSEVIKLILADPRDISRHYGISIMDAQNLKNFARNNVGELFPQLS